MKKNIEIADEVGLLKIPQDTLIDLGSSRGLYGDEIVYLVTGSQGESRAALNQIAGGSYKGLEIEKGDTVVLSARIIPGNEKSISRMIGLLYKHGANIIEEKRRLIHVSGHASQEDIRIMVETARPKFVVPIHGDYRLLFRQKEFVKNHLGYDENNIVLIENGDVLELEADRAAVIERRQIGKVFIDEEGFGEVEHETVRERKKLAYGGMISLVVVIDRENAKLKSPPQISLQGVAGMNVTSGMLDGARDAIIEAVNKMTREEFLDHAWVKENLRIHLKRYIQRETGSRPVIVATVVEV
jgi:ribonuclease J